MKNKKTKWLIYTVLMGLMPIICKLFLIIFLIDKQWSIVFNELDFAAFGLVLSVSNLNELQTDISENFQENWHIWSIGLSIILIIFFAIIFAISALTDISSMTSNKLFNRTSLKFGAIFLAVCSFFYSQMIFNKVNLKSIKNN